MSIHTARMNIMSADQFSNRTKATKAVCGFSSRFKSRGSNMDGIDAALGLWDRIYNSNDARKKLRALDQIQLACVKWNGRKRTKSSSLAEYRKQVVNELLVSVKKAMHYLLNKSKAGQKQKGHQTTSLKPGYAFEREQYVASGKQQQPYAAGAFDHADLGNIADVGAFAARGDQDGIERVYFLDRSQRMALMAYVEGGLFYDDGKPLDSPAEPGRQQRDGSRPMICDAYMYAVDRYGSLYHKKITGYDGTYFNHSSFCAGRQVICAGTAIWENGRLKYISNSSGHYKPPAPQLHRYLVLLGEEGVDLSDVCVEITQGNSSRCLRAVTFLNSIQAGTDWPHMKGPGAHVMIGGQLAEVRGPSG